eukprot:m.12423 g.12423  ORF g.12423 m.12423 type:complete len:319 (+) comp7767_c0_seq1:356-1312(+)
MAGDPRHGQEDIHLYLDSVFEQQRCRFDIKAAVGASHATAVFMEYEPDVRLGQLLPPYFGDSDLKFGRPIERRVNHRVRGELDRMLSSLWSGDLHNEDTNDNSVECSPDEDLHHQHRKWVPRTRVRHVHVAEPDGRAHHHRELHRILPGVDVGRLPTFGPIGHWVVQHREENPETEITNDVVDCKFPPRCVTNRVEPILLEVDPPLPASIVPGWSSGDVLAVLGHDPFAGGIAGGEQGVDGRDVVGVRVVIDVSEIILIITLEQRLLVHIYIRTAEPLHRRRSPVTAWSPRSNPMRSNPGSRAHNTSRSNCGAVMSSA